MAPLAVLAPVEEQTKALLASIAVIDHETVERETPTRYFEDSDLYQLKGGFEIEFVHKPRLKSISRELQTRITQDLGRVLLSAFQKDETNGKELVTEDKIYELALNVDSLLVGRKNGTAVSFHSGVLIEPWLYYSKATFVDPSEQNAGLGLLSIFLSGYKQVLSTLGPGNVPWVVTRTRNYMVARMVENGCEYYSMSTERNLDNFSQNVFKMTARYLKNELDPNTGIVKNIYLPGIPQGPNPKDERIKQAMEILGPCDGCYIAGKMNGKRASMILNKYVTDITVKRTEEALVA